jgi:hypothetical protein
MAIDLSAIAKWPNVPACYDWLSLDRRGDWRLQGERVMHRGLINFMNRQYGCDASGCWFVQNGPQRVFVKLAYTPWVFHFSAGDLHSQMGEAAGPALACVVDEEGSVLLQTATGIGLLDDRDLADFMDACRDKHNAAVNEEKWLELMSGKTDETIYWQDLPLKVIQQHEVASRFLFNPHPQP